MGDQDPIVGPVRLGAYAARSCAVRTQWDVVRPCEPAPDHPFLAELGRRGIDFEADVFVALVDAHPDAVVIDRLAPTAEREQRTRQALDAGARLVLGPRLPHDVRTGRVGEPDLLVRWGPTGYVPVDVKHHRTLDKDAPDDLRGAQPLAEIGRSEVPPRPRDAGGGDGLRGDLLQLAHYWRMLEDLGDAALHTPFGAIVGRERLVVWYDLAESRFANVRGRAADRRSALEVYDLEYSERRSVALASIAHLTDPMRPLPLAPVSISECPDCRWRVHCRPILEERQDVSLLPRVTRPAWESLRRIGADTIPALASLPATMQVDGMTDGAFAAAVMNARARSGSEVAYRRPGVTEVAVGRGDVEVDVDMENVEEGAYLWGAFVTDHAGARLVQPGYHSFVDWNADAATAGERAFDAFWAWMTQLRADCAARGLTFRAFCWSAAAENRWLREGAWSLGLVDDVEAFIDSDEWVDLMRVFDARVITGRTSGLKVVAPLLGFAWGDEDPSGAASMVWWQEAVDADCTPQDQERTRLRILDYNADDVRATLHVRTWMREHGPRLMELPNG